MEIKLEKNLEKCEAKFNVTVDGQEWKDACQKATENLAKKVTVKGFRKGHAPLAQAVRYIRPNEILENAADRAVSKAYSELAKQTEVVPFIQPELVVSEFNQEKFVFFFNIVTRPVITLGKYKGLKVEKKKVEVTKADIDRELESLANKNAELIVVEGEVESVNGDTLTIDFKGFVDGKAFDGGEAQDYDLELGSHTFVPGFEEQLVGTKTGDTKDVVINFPENYVEPLAGKEATFKVTVKQIKHKVVPEINDDLVAELDMEGVDTLEQLKAKLHDQVKERKETQAKNEQFNKLLETVANNCTFVCHEKILKKDQERIVDDFKARLEQQGFGLEDYFRMTGTTMENLESQAHDEALKNAKHAFLYEEIANQEKIEVSDADVDSKLEEIGKQYGQSVEDLRKQLGDRIGNYKFQLKQEKVDEFLRSNNEL